MQTEYNSDTDQSKQSLSPKFNFQHGESSELSFGEDPTSPRGQRVVKPYRKLRPNSAPRTYVTDTSNWRDYNLPSYCVPDFRRTPAIYIEQDIINKQRQEIQLLMEELGNRDQELNDLVMSHQKQVKAWECDNEKQKSLQTRLSQCEDELKSREEKLNRTLIEMAHVNEQREVDALELNRTQNDMIKLTERIMENSLYIKEMETQNQKLNISMKDFLSAKQAFSSREQELLSFLKEKDMLITEKQRECSKLSDHVKYLECQCQELGEKNNNMNEESVNWKKKFSQMKEEAERLNDECKKKDENLQKMTQQLHESLQQSIALQKALFTSCEREKCKEEVMYSLRKQHKRTMQELQNIRELYDRLSRDSTLYHLSVKDKEGVGDGTKKEEENTEEESRKKKDNKRIDEVDKWRQEGRRKMNTNMSFHKLKESENIEENFLIKEMKDRKPQSREEKNTNVSGERNTENKEEKHAENIGEKNTNFGGKTDKPKVHGQEFMNAPHDTFERHPNNITPTILKNGGQTSSVLSKSGHITQFRNASTVTSSTTIYADEAVFGRPGSSRMGFINSASHTESNYTQHPSRCFGNSSRNADIRDSRTPSISHMGASSGKSDQPHSNLSTTTSYQNVPDGLIGMPYKSPGMQQLEYKDVDMYSDGSPNGSPSRYDARSAAHSDGMCKEHKKGNNPMNTDHKGNMNQLHKSDAHKSSTESRNVVNGGVLSKHGEEFETDTNNQKFSSTDDEIITTSKKSHQKTTMQSHFQEEATNSRSEETQSQLVSIDSSSSVERKRCCSGSQTSSQCMYSKLRQRSEGHRGGLSPGRVGRRHRTSSETRSDEIHILKTEFSAGRGRCEKVEYRPNQKQKCAKNCCKTSNNCKNHVDKKINNLEKNEGKLCGDSCEQLKLCGDSCKQCKTGNNIFCDCCRIQKSYSPQSETAAADTFNLSLAKSGISYIIHNNIKTLAPNNSFKETSSNLECCTSVGDSQAYSVRSSQNFKESVGMSVMRGLTSGSSLNQINKTKYFSVPAVELCHNQIPISCQPQRRSKETLPDDVSDYLARNRTCQEVLPSELSAYHKASQEVLSDEVFAYLDRQRASQETLSNNVSAHHTSSQKGLPDKLSSYPARHKASQKALPDEVFVYLDRQRASQIALPVKLSSYHKASQKALPDEFPAGYKASQKSLPNEVFVYLDRQRTSQEALPNNLSAHHTASQKALPDDMFSYLSQHKASQEALPDKASAFPPCHRTSKKGLPDEVSAYLAHHRTSIEALPDKVPAFSARHRVTQETLPDELSAYLARHHPVRQEMYYNNNNRSEDHSEPELDNICVIFQNRQKMVKQLCSINSYKEDIFGNSDGCCINTDQLFVLNLDGSVEEGEQKQEQIQSERRRKEFYDGGDSRNNRMDFMHLSHSVCLDVESEYNAGMDVKDEDNAGLDLKGEDNTGLDVKDEDNAGLDVKNKGNGRLDVNDKDNARRNVKGNTNAGLDVKDKGRSEQDVKNTFNTGLDVIDKCNIELDVKSLLCESEYKSSLLKTTPLYVSEARLTTRQFLYTQKTQTGFQDSSGGWSFFFRRGPIQRVKYISIRRPDSNL